MPSVTRNGSTPGGKFCGSHSAPHASLPNSPATQNLTDDERREYTGAVMLRAGQSSMRATATEIVRQLQRGGFVAYWVGGCVRDSLLGREPGDYDIATNARTEEIEKLFPQTIPVGRQFGVVIVVADGRQFQVATFRAESDYADGRRPSQVSFGDPQADALRRDFTVNGLFYDPLTDTTHDWVGGVEIGRAHV